jgi:hypothetical protein
MSTKRHISLRSGPTAAPALAGLFALAMASLAAAQEPAAQPERRGFFGSIGQWFEDQASNIGSGFSGARKQVEGFGREAGVAARSTAEGAKDAADAVVRLPGTRPVRGHETCRTAPNGAPDCVAAANALCKSKGFASGKSLDMTTAEVCPPKVYLSGRTSDSDCRTETFVSRALCQ